MDELEAAVRAGYDRWAARYDDADASTALDEPLVLRLAAPLAGRRALDLGCGTGRYARLLAAAGARVVGVDLSRAMLRRAAVARAVGWVQASATALPFADGAFELATCGLVVDHLASPAAAFAELARVLSTGGRALLTAIHPAMQQCTGADVDAAGARIPGRIHAIDDLARAAEAAGLVEVARHELAVDGAMARDRRWAWRVGVPALVVLELERR